MNVLEEVIDTLDNNLTLKRNKVIIVNNTNIEKINNDFNRF